MLAAMFPWLNHSFGMHSVLFFWCETCRLVLWQLRCCAEVSYHSVFAWPGNPLVTFLSATRWSAHAVVVRSQAASPHYAGLERLRFAKVVHEQTLQEGFMQLSPETCHMLSCCSKMTGRGGIHCGTVQRFVTLPEGAPGALAMLVVVRTVTDRSGQHAPSNRQTRC